MEDVGIFCSHLVYFPGHLANFIWPFGIFSPFWYILPVLVCCPKTSLATLFLGSFGTHDGREIASGRFGTVVKCARREMKLVNGI
jgi:hypothetical protein